MLIITVRPPDEDHRQCRLHNIFHARFAHHIGSSQHLLSRQRCSTAILWPILTSFTMTPPKEWTTNTMARPLLHKPTQNETRTCRSSSACEKTFCWAGS